MQKIKICYLINKPFLNLTYESIGWVKKFFRSKNHELLFDVFHFGDILEQDTADIKFISMNKIEELHLFLHRPYMFEKNEGKIIFLDSDTIVQTCISKLYDIELEENVLGVCQCYNIKILSEFSKRHPITQELIDVYGDYLTKPVKYFNAGVMLVDCDKWKDLNLTQKFFDIYNLFKNSVFNFSDELAFNLLFDNDSVKWLDGKWNYNLPDNSRRYITHYYGKPKKIS